ncbi:MAG: hypothetical protein PW788_02125 [Micavibrio sp.]|nr:hypothetical protein [Micavibrio sp.]
MTRAMQDTPADKPDTPAQKAAQNSAAAADAAGISKTSRWQAFKDITRRRATICKNFGRELFSDHSFWVEALAVKGGASAILITGIAVATYVVALPFLAMAGGIVAATGLIGIGVYGITAGSVKGWESLKGIYARSTGKAPATPVYTERQDIIQRLKAKPAVQKILQHPMAEKFFNSRAWKTTEKFTSRREDSILGGIAVGGAALTLTLGGIALATQLLVLPVIAVGTLLTFATVTAATTLASGCSGLYFSITGIRDRAKHKAEMKAHAEAEARLAAQQPLPPVGAAITIPLPVDASAKPAALTLAERFDTAVAQPAAINDNTGESPAKLQPAKAPKATPPAA